MSKLKADASAASPSVEIIQNNNEYPIESIDTTSKNKFLWKWLEVQDSQ